MPQLAFEVSRVLSAVAFLFYGLSCLFSPHMVREFERYGVARMRRLTGLLEVAGALGLLVGILYPPLLLAASGGLALLMLLGVATRIRIRDPLRAMVPALVLFLVNGYVLVFAATAGSTA